MSSGNSNITNDEIVVALTGMVIDMIISGGIRNFPRDGLSQL